MRVSILLTLDDGQRLEGEVELAAIGTASAALEHPLSAVGRRETKKLPAFELGVRAFMKRYAGSLSGPKRFALMVAYLSHGSMEAKVPMSEVERSWNKMKPIMGGMFNTAYAVRAKEDGLVDSPKRGSYVLLPDWHNILVQ